MAHHSLASVSRALTVEQLMVRVDHLSRSSSYEEAQVLHREYDVVPYPKRGAIRGYYYKGTQEERPIDLRILVSAESRILDLPGLFASSSFFFVISSNKIIGYLHFSDLNNPAAKIPFYAHLQFAEKAVWDRLRGRIREDDLPRVIEGKQVKEAQRKRAKNRKRNVDLGWEGAFTLPSILKLARFYQVVKLTDEQIKLFVSVRNRVAHADRSLVSQFSDVRDLSAARAIADRLVKST